MYIYIYALKKNVYIFIHIYIYTKYVYIHIYISSHTTPNLDISINQVSVTDLLANHFTRWSWDDATCCSPKKPCRKWCFHDVHSMTFTCTLWWTNILPWKDPPFFMGKSTISMAIFHCYVSSPEGTSYFQVDGLFLPPVFLIPSGNLP